MLAETFVCYRFIDLVESYVYCAFVKLYFLELYLKTFIKIFCTVIVLYLPEIYLFILFYLFIRYLIEIYLSKIYQAIFPRIFYILWFINKIFLNLSDIVYTKEQSKIRGKSREEIGRECDQISQTIKKKCYS